MRKLTRRVSRNVSGYVWSTAACIPCHKGGAPAFDHATFFPIATGDMHAGIACQDCHGATRAIADLQCVACHTHDKATTDAAHLGLTGYQYDSPSCYNCHQDSTIPPFDHTGFPIAAGTTHSAFSCQDCHSASRAVADLTCTTCHTNAHAQIPTDAAHVSVTSYLYASPSCYNCHPDGSVPLPAGHDTLYFPVTGTKHAGVACSQCHGATKTPTDVTCVPCHQQSATATTHTAIPAQTQGSCNAVTYTNYQRTTAKCLDCHADGQVNLIASHPAVLHGLTGEGHAPFCLTCHTTMRTNKTWAADFSANTCLACHTDSSGGGNCN